MSPEHKAMLGLIDADEYIRQSDAIGMPEAIKQTLAENARRGSVIWMETCRKRREEKGNV